MSRPARAGRAVLAVLLLLPVSASAGASTGCRLDAPSLAVDLAQVCEAVRAAVPEWDGTATVRVEPGDPAVAGESWGDTVRLHQPAWSRLTPVGRRVVLIHELVHVATAEVTTRRTPAWLVEGLAEAVALRGSGLPDRVAARELVAWVRVHGLPTSLPSVVDDPVDYAQSWLLVDALQRRLGPSAVLRLYRDAGRVPLADALSGLTTVPGLLAVLRAEIARRLS